MIFPNLRIQVWKLTGTDIYGQPRFFRMPDERCAPVKMQFRAQHTSVRTDSAATHGQAMEGTATVVFLVNPTSKIDITSKIVVNAHTLRVMEIRERHDSFGTRLDHYEVHCDVWV